MAYRLGPRALIPLLALVIVGGILGSIVLSYNSLTTKDQTVTAQWAQVENEYQRKINLIPTLVSIARNYTQFERSVLENITRLRSAWLNASGLEQRINVSTELDQNLFLIRATYEAYPELQSQQIVQNLMFSLEGTENRIATERMRYNEAVRVFNTSIATFPNVLCSGGFGFRARPYFDPIPGGP